MVMGTSTTAKTRLVTASPVVAHAASWSSSLSLGRWAWARLGWEPQSLCPTFENTENIGKEHEDKEKTWRYMKFTNCSHIHNAKRSTNNAAAKHPSISTTLLASWLSGSFSSKVCQWANPQRKQPFNFFFNRMVLDRKWLLLPICNKMMKEVYTKHVDSTGIGSKTS